MSALCYRVADARDPTIQAIRGRISGVARRRRNRARDRCIRQARRRGLSYRELGRRFRVSHVMAWKVCNRGWIMDRPFIPHPRGRRRQVLTEPGAAKGRTLRWIRVETDSGISCFPMIGDYAREEFFDRVFRLSRSATISMSLPMAPPAWRRSPGDRRGGSRTP